MAEINIQRRKRSVSPWLLILLVLALLGAGLWYLLQKDSEPAAPAEPVPATAPAGSTATPSEEAPTASDPADLAQEAGSEPADFYAFVADDPASPDYARRGLSLLSGVLVTLADRDDLRTTEIAERRNDLTSATSQLGEGGNLRAGFVASAQLLQAMQRQGYATLERDAALLTAQAGELSGRTATPAEQQATQRFFQQAANVLRVLEKPAA